MVLFPEYNSNTLHVVCTVNIAQYKHPASMYNTYICETSVNKLYFMSVSDNTCLGHLVLLHVMYYISCVCIKL